MRGWSCTPCGLLGYTICESRCVYAVRGWWYRRVQAIRETQRSLIVLFACQFFWAYSYFLGSAVLVQTLTRNAGLTDFQAGIVYSAYGLLISVYGMITGFVVDYTGVFECILVGSIVGAVGRAALAALLVADVLTGTETHLAGAIVLLATLIPASDALIGQVIGLGVKRYTGVRLDDNSSFEDVLEEEAKPESRSTEYSASYALQNVAAMLSFGTIVLFNFVYPTAEDAVNRGALLSVVPALVVTAALSLYGLRNDTFNVDLLVAKSMDAKISEDNIREEENQNEEASERLGYASRSMVRAANGGRCARCCALCMPRPLKRLVRSLNTVNNGILVRYIVMALLLVPVKTLFRHLDATLPKYTQREFDPNFSYAMLLLINPILCIILAVPLGALLKPFSDFRVILAGTTLCCLSVALGMVPSVPVLMAYIVLFSIGEIIWSPRLQSYFYTLAPRGEEGAFGALASVPTFLAKLPVGLLSGALLDRYCPSYGACDSWALWGVIGASAAVTPVMLALTACWIVPSTRADTPQDRRSRNGSRRKSREHSTSTNGTERADTIELDMMTPRVYVNGNGHAKDV